MPGAGLFRKKDSGGEVTHLPALLWCLQICANKLRLSVDRRITYRATRLNSKNNEPQSYTWLLVATALSCADKIGSSGAKWHDYIICFFNEFTEDYFDMRL